MSAITRARIDVPQWVRSHASVARLVVLGGFAISRVVYWILGVRYDVSGLDFSSQLIERTVLRDRLAESVWYLHAQPPAYNLFVGFVLRWSPFSPELSFALLFLALGVVLALTLQDLGYRLGMGTKTSVAVTLLIVCVPTTVLYENWLSYEYPVAVMLVVLADLVARYGRRPSTATLVGATSIAATATLTRSLLHPIWLVVVFAALILYRRPPRRRAIAYAALPLVVVLGFVVKNEILFGTPQLSSWFGYNLNKVVVQPLDDDQRLQLGAEGFVPAPVEPCVVQHPDVPALSEEFKGGPDADPQNRVENFNYECLVAKYQALGSDAATVARTHKRWTVRNVLGGFELWSEPASINPFVYANRNEVGAIDDVVRRVALVDFAWDPPIAVPTAWPLGVSAPDRRFHVSITLILATLAASIASIVALVRWRRRDERSLTHLIGGGTVLFATLAGNFFEYGENNRIRYIVEPLTFILAAALLAAAIRAIATWYRTRSPGAVDDDVDIDVAVPTDPDAQPAPDREAEDVADRS